MINYFIAGALTMMAIVSWVSGLEANALITGALFLTVAVLVILARWQQEKFAYDLLKAVEDCKAAHPSAWPKVTEPYDWSKDQEGTE